MIESIKPAACPHVYEVEALYTKVLPKGQRGCLYELTAEVSVKIEKTPDDWIARIEKDGLYDWGEGSTEEEAINDLVCSLGEFRLALNKYRTGLPDGSVRTLGILKDLVRQIDLLGPPDAPPSHQNCSEARSAEQADETDEKAEILANYTKALPRGEYCCGHSLKVDLLVQIEHTLEGWGATVENERLFEYGWGATEEQAINDLVCSLGDVRLSLIDYKDELGERSTHELEMLEDMVT